MAEKNAEVTICTRPGCDQPVSSLCASCRLVGYCCRTCQVEDWPRHKEEDCQGHLRKIGMAHLQKAKEFTREFNYVQVLRCSDLALVKLKQLTDRPIEALDDALRLKFTAANVMGRNREALECAQERYCLYLTSHTHPPAIRASFNLIESCIHNEEFEDAELYARTTWETITLSRDSHIPDTEREWFTAQGAYHLAQAMLALAQGRDIPPEANQTVGQEAIGLARRALEIHTQLYGLENEDVANAMSSLADVIDYFNNVDDDEVLRLYEQSIAIQARVEGCLSVNVAVGNCNLADAYEKRAKRAFAANDLDGEVDNLESALIHLREAARIYTAANHIANADRVAQLIVGVSEKMQQCTAARAAAAVATTTTTTTTRG